MSNTTEKTAVAVAASRPGAQADHTSTATPTADTPAASFTNRRGMLRTMAGIAAATLGAGTLLESQASIAHADSVGTFSSSNPAIPAVSATGTSGADGIHSSCDGGTALLATTTSTDKNAAAIVATGQGVAAGVVAASPGHYGLSASGVYGVYTTSSAGTPDSAALWANGTAGTTGIVASSDSGWALHAASAGAFAIYASTSGADGIVGVSDKAGVHGTSLGAGAGIFGESANGYGAEFTGGLAALRLDPVGTAGPPRSGTHQMGELMVDKNGVPHVCTASGTPGTWKRIVLR